MPFVVTHILIPLIAMALIKDVIESKRSNKSFSLHYVLIAGLAGVIPDLDIAAFWILHFFGFSFSQVHGTIMHTVFVPLLFLVLYVLFSKADVNARVCNIGKHNLKLSIIFLMLAFGSAIHVSLDFIEGSTRLFYPFVSTSFGLSLGSLLPDALQRILEPSLDAALLILWLLYLEFRHKISDYI